MSSSNQILERYKLGTKRLDELLASQRNTLNKQGLGYNTCNPSSNNYRTLKDQNALHLKCTFCKFVGHVFKKCPIRNGKPFRIKKVWIPKGIFQYNQDEPKTTWVPKKG